MASGLARRPNCQSSTPEQALSSSPLFWYLPSQLAARGRANERLQPEVWFRGVGSCGLRMAGRVRWLWLGHVSASPLRGGWEGEQATIARKDGWMDGWQLRSKLQPTAWSCR